MNTASKCLKDLSGFLSKHAPAPGTIPPPVLESLHKAALENTEGPKKEAEAFLANHQRLNLLTSDELAQILNAARTVSLDEDWVQKVVALSESKIYTREKEYQAKLAEANKKWEDEGKDEASIKKHMAKSEFSRANIYFHNALGALSKRILVECCGKGGPLNTESLKNANADIGNTLSDLKALFDSQKWGTTATRAEEISPEISDYTNTWSKAIRFWQSIYDTFKKWVAEDGGPEKIKSAANRYLELLDDIVANATICCNAYVNNAQEVKGSSVGWNEIQKAKKEPTLTNISAALKTIINRKDLTKKCLKNCVKCLNRWTNQGAKNRKILSFF